MKWLTFLKNKYTAYQFVEGVFLAIVYSGLIIWARYNDRLRDISFLLIILVLGAIFIFFVYDSLRFANFFKSPQVRLLAVSTTQLYAINIVLTIVNLLLYSVMFLVILVINTLIISKGMNLPLVESTNPFGWLLMLGGYLILQFLFLIVTSLWQLPHKKIALTGLIVSLFLIGRLVNMLGNGLFQGVSGGGLLIIFGLMVFFSIGGSLFLVNHYLEGESK